MKSLLGCVLSLFLGVQVAIASPSPAQALAFERAVWLARTGFHQLALGGNAEEDRETLEQTLAQGRRTVEVMAGAWPEEADQVQRLREQWQAYETRAQDNPLATLGYADFDALSELNRLAWSLAQRAQPFVGGELSDADRIMKARVVLHRLSSEYLALASFPSAGLNNGTEGAEQVDFRQEVLRLDTLLTSLQPQAQEAATTRRLLSQVQLRWSFVRDSLLEMEQAEVNRVPLLLYRYSLQIDRDLARLAEAAP